MELSKLLHQFLETAEDPAADPRRTVVLIAIGLVILMIVAVVVIMLLPPEKREDDESVSEEAAQAESARHSKVLLIVSLALVLLVLVGLAYGDRRSRQDAACRSCHVLESQVSSWEQGSHTKVGCIECHTSPGVFGLVETRIRALADLINNLGVRATLSAPAIVNEENCRSCHGEALSGVLTVGKLRVRHLDFVDRLPCSQCHGRVGHDGAGGSLASPVMTSCADCHDGETASRDCSTCHVGDIAYAGRGPAEYAPVQLAAPTTCRGCHSLERCTECHGIEMPHPQGWADPKSHAPSGAFDAKVCVRCHDAGCTSCHMQIHISHGPDWKTKHQTAERRTCTQCHNPEKVGTDMCRLCHASASRG